MSARGSSSNSRPRASGRCDLRVDKTGTPYMLEINANCGIYYPPADYGSADICLSLDPAGHAGFTRQLIRRGIRAPCPA